MARGAQILNGVVVNVVVYDGAMVFPGFETVNITNIDPAPGIGWAYANGVFTPPDYAAIEAAKLQALYAAAKALLTADDAISKKEKAVLLVILDEFNTHSVRINGILSAVAAATSLANLQTRMALVQAMPTRTATDLKTAVSNKIDNGDANG